MYDHLFKPVFITTSLIFFTLPQFLAKDNEQYIECSRHLKCGENYQILKFPFWGANLPLRCGLAGFEVTCVNNDFTAINISSDYSFRVVAINESTQEIRLARDYTPTEFCPQRLEYKTLNEGLFTYSPYITEDLRLFDDCPNYSSQLANISINSIRNIKNETCGGKWIANSTVFNKTFSEAQKRDLVTCKTKMRVLVNVTTLEEFRYNSTISLQQVLNEVFVVNYKMNYNVSACSVCMESGGLCWSGTVLSSPTCLCRNGVSQVRCRKGDKLRSTKVILGSVAGASSATFIVLALCIYYRRKRSHDDGESFISRNADFYPSSTSDFEKPASTYKGVPLFSYNELQKATNNFDSRKELGDGGYGKVYKGKLQDGRVVAVKRLYESKLKRVAQFMNEIEILTRLHHHNLVSLYGCTSHQCQQLLIVYEFIRNGTIADHLYGERSKPISLTWKTRMNIAIETASALSYLHASDVIHRDVKTTNILLDDNYCVKVADFGLSRLFPFNVTHVSTAPQGTPGYVDPEYHQCYQLTDKSDVFSFGVVLIELISSMPAVDFSRHGDEINLSSMAIKKIQNNSLHELVDPSLGYESDYVARKMITEVAELAFQCLQNGRDFRPTMNEVLHTLIGIKSRYLDTNKSMDIDTSADDALLLKNCPELLSPDSVTVKWNNNLTKSISS